MSTGTFSKLAVPGTREKLDSHQASNGWYIYTEGSWEEVGGTSATAPNLAAFTLDYDTAPSSPTSCKT